MKIILGSASPARATLLHNAGITFDVLVSGVDEDALLDQHSHLPPAEIVTKLAEAKAQAVAESVKTPAFVIAADSMFHFEGMLLGKPLDVAIARERLNKMQGKFGELVTGHAVINTVTGVCHSAAGAAVVQFTEMNELEIEAYLATGEPLNVAGNFTLDGLGAAFINHVSGDPAAVVGLSISTLRKLINNHGFEYTQLWQLGSNK
jgi:septum formation protein